MDMDDKPGHKAEADKGATVPFFRVASKSQQTGPLPPPKPSRSPECPPLRSGEVDDEAEDDMVEVAVEDAAAAAAATLTPKHAPKAMPVRREPLRRPKSPEGPPPVQRPGARRPKSPEGFDRGSSILLSVLNPQSKLSQSSRNSSST